MSEEKKKRWRPSLTAYRELEERVSELESRNNVLEKSNMYMEEELKKLRSRNSIIENENRYLKEESGMLKSRGFWARVLNREV